MTIHPKTIRRVFWHRTRRTFVPLTSEEYRSRLGWPYTDATNALVKMIRMGVVKKTKGSEGHDRIYELTDIGVKLVGDA